jgi:hypothetical protein
MPRRNIEGFWIFVIYQSAFNNRPSYENVVILDLLRIFVMIYDHLQWKDFDLKICNNKVTPRECEQLMRVIYSGDSRKQLSIIFVMCIDSDDWFTLSIHTFFTDLQTSWWFEKYKINFELHFFLHCRAKQLKKVVKKDTVLGFRHFFLKHSNPR